MKHNSLISANEPCSLPCGSSHGKSSSFTLRNSLLMPLVLLFLLIVGNGAAWADGYYAVHGNNWQGTDGGQWNDNNNKARMSHQSDGVYWCDKVAVNNGTTILFKILYGSGYEGSGFDWGNQITATAIDNSLGNATLLNDNSDNRIQFTATENVDLYIYTNGTKVWANAVRQGSASLSGKTIRLQGDLWTVATSGDWAINSCSPTLQVSPAGEMATTAFYIPAGMNDKYTKARWETFVNGTKTNYNEARFIGCTDDGSASAKIIAKIQNSTSCVKYVKVEYTSARTTVTVTDPPAMTGNWYLWIDKVYKGQFVDGKVDIEDFPVGSGLHSIFVTNRTESQIGEHKDKTVKDYFSQGIEWLGGLYIDTEHSDVTTWKKGRYYKDASNYTKFSNREDFALINGGTDYNDARGGFQYNTVANVRFTLNNGVITINTFTPEPGPEPTTTYTVTLHPNNGGGNIVRENVPEGSNSSASALNLSAITYGTGTATWYTNPECTTPFSTVTSDMHLYAKWGVSGNYYVVGDLWMYNSNGDWDNNKGQLMTNTNGVCTVTYTAPKGLNRIEIIKDKDWNQKINGGSYSAVLNASSPISLSVNSGHIAFTLAEAKRVTITFDGKVSVSATDYTFDQSVSWRVKTSDSGWGNNPNSWDHSNVMTKTASGASIIIQNVPANTNHSFMITRGSDEQATVGTYNFNALWLDTSNPSSGLTWNMQNTNIGDRQLAQTDNEWRNCSFRLSVQSDLRITFDGGKIRCDIVAPNTITFNSNGGSAVASQEVSNGGTASEPSAPTKTGYTFVKWQLNGVDYHFTETVTEDITLDAVWAYKAISSVVLNESTHMTWVGNTDFTLTPTYDPSDLIAKSVAWSSDNTSVATVSNGTVHAEGAGSATITCTVTDQFDHQETATCEVTVAACEMATDNLYSMTVTGYNSSTGSSATLTDLWNESTENGVMTQTARLVRIAFKDLATEYMTEDANGKVAGRSSITDDSDKWMYYSAGTGFFYLQNYNTGHFLYKDKSTGLMGQNGDWKFYGTKAASYADADTYRWLENGSGDQLRICNKDGYNGNLNGSHTLMRYYVDAVDGWNTPYVHCGLGGHQGNNPIRAIITQIEASVDNPFFVSSLMNGSYYRMNTNATVQANLGGALVPGAVITVRLYADAATTVKLQKTDGTEIETINLTADTEREYTYTGSALVGESAFVIKATDNHAGIASIVVARTYAIRLAQLIEETEIGGTLTLTCDYATDNAVINKAITINGQGHTIGNLTVEQTGDLTLSSALTVNDFTICAKAGNTSIPAASGQVRNANNLTVSGNAYFLYTVDPNGHVQYGWYDFTVPFPVNAASGIKGIQEGVLKENFAYGPDYAIMDYNGEKQAQGQYPYKKFSGIMQPNKLYSITLDNDFNYNTLRMQKTAEGDLVAGDNVTLEAHTGIDLVHANWNGVGNGTLHHADADNLSVGYVQVYQSGDKTFLPVDKSQYSFVVGTAFMVQQSGTMVLNQATHGALLAPSRYESAPAIAIQIAHEGQPFSDQLFISASETGGQDYTPGSDLAKAGDLGSANVPQIWTTAYNSPLCVHEAQLIDGEASYNLSIYAPAADTYTLTSQNIPADYSLYLTQNGTMLTELNGTYTLDLSKGITTEYGLLLVETYKTPTGIEEIGSRKSVIRKIMHNGVLYILHNGKIYNAQGAKVK